MLEEHLHQLASDLEMDSNFRKDETTSLYHLFLPPDMQIVCKDLDPGLYLSAHVGPLPARKKEEAFLYFMKANFLGQGTGGRVLGLDSEEKFLTLVHKIPYDMNYKAFKEQVEEFANYLGYWRSELNRLQKEAQEELM